MKIHSQTTTPTVQRFGLLSEVQDTLMDVQARLMDKFRTDLAILRDLRKLQYMLQTQVDTL